MSGRRTKKTIRSRYKVKAELDNFELVKAKSALKLEIYGRSGKLGELQVGRGSIFWWGHKRQIAKRISWGRFAEMMNELAYGVD
jgi:hypothetical protein